MGDFGNAFRNFVLATFLGVGLLFLSLYISGLAMTFLEYKQLTPDFALSLQPLNTLLTLIEFWIANYATIDFYYDNYKTYAMR